MGGVLQGDEPVSPTLAFLRRPAEWVGEAGRRMGLRIAEGAGLATHHATEYPALCLSVGSCHVKFHGTRLCVLLQRGVEMIRLKAKVQHQDFRTG